MQTSFFKVDRSLLNSNRWLAEPFSRGQAWLDIFGLAQHSDSFIRVRGFKIDVKRGQLARSLCTLSTRWKWSKDKVIRYLKELENDGDISMQKNNRITLITVIKYDSWQGGKYADVTANLTDNLTPDRPQNSTQNSTQTDRKPVTYKNVKNVKKEKNVKNSVETTSLRPAGSAAQPDLEELVFPDLQPVLLDGHSTELVPASAPSKKKPDKAPGVNDVLDVFYELNPVINYSNAAYRDATAEIIKRVGIEEAVGYANAAIRVQGTMYAPVITNPLQLRDKLGELIGFMAKTQDGQKVRKIIKV